MSWRDELADTYDDFVGEFDELLRRLENAEAMCQALSEPRMETETRGYAGGIRAFRNDLASRARDLRNVTEPWTVLPMSLTTRHVRSLDE